MTNYRRSRIAGATYFFTVNLAERSRSLLLDHIALLRAAFRHVRIQHPYAIDAIVVLPEHLHAIWTLPADDSDFALRWRLIKTIFSRGLPGNERRSASRQAKHERGIWQRRYWEHLIRTTFCLPVPRPYGVPCSRTTGIYYLYLSLGGTDEDSQGVHARQQPGGTAAQGIQV